MDLYYFDTYDGEAVDMDEMGLEFADLETVKVEAARALADLVKDVVPGSLRRELAIVVRDDQSRQVLKIIMVFEVLMLI